MIRSIINIITLFIVFNGYGQNRWTKVYHDELDAPKLRFTESYDHGYLLMGRIHYSYPRYNWLIKTDINGDVLWEKILGDGVNTIRIFDIEMNLENDLYLGGGTMILDPYHDPFLMKLNECREKEWCKIIPSEGNADYIYSICPTLDGGCAVTLLMTGETGFIDRICLAKFSKDGEYLWKQCYNSNAAMGNEYCLDLTLAPDNGFLLTGYCYYSNPWDTLAYLCPYYIKADSSGNFEWETIAGFHPNNIGGIGRSTVISPDSNYFYSSISHYYRNGIGDAPGLLKMDMLGNIDTVYDLFTPNEVGILYDARFASDSTLVASAGWGAITTTPKAVVIDTIGNILDEQYLLDNIYMSDVRITFDNKYLFYTHKYYEDEDQYDVFLFKLNQNLESDTFYSYPYQYDTLCPYSIISDTIVQDSCDIIVGIEEKKEREEELDRMVIYPNPAESIIHCRVFADECRCLINVYDMYGKKVDEAYLPKNQKEIQFDVSYYSPGIYIAVLMSENHIIAKQKFLVLR